MKASKLLYIGSSLLVALLAVCVSTALCQAKKCPMDKVEKAYQCPDCKKIADAAGNCPDCGVALKEIEACVRTGYVCEDCGTCSLKAGKCATCGKDLTEKVVKSPMGYKCPKCEKWQETEGNCPDCGVALEKSCKDAGTCPHVSE